MHTVVAYIPALHRGYIDFFKKYRGRLFILGEDFLHRIPRLERDIRALTPIEVKAAVHALGIFSEVKVLDKENISELRAADPIIMPDELVSREFREVHLKDAKVEFVSVFLRWDKQISQAEFVVPPDRVISQNEFDREMIGKTSELAKKSPDWWRQLGAIVVRDGKVLVEDYNKMVSEYAPNVFGDPRSDFNAGERYDLVKTIHAEAGTIAEAAKKGIPLEGASMYVTVFPCPVCAKSIAYAGIKKVYYEKGYSVLDAEDVLRGAGVEIVLVK